MVSAHAVARHGRLKEALAVGALGRALPPVRAWQIFIAVS
jgi:hypothetical protein